MSFLQSSLEQEPPSVYTTHTHTHCLLESHLVCLSLALCLAAASHDGIDVNVSVEAGGRQQHGVPGAPLDVEAPLAAGGQLVQHLENSKWKFA